jgi:hypothetical protein
MQKSKKARSSISGQSSQTQVLESAEEVIKRQVAANRREEIRRYLQLFGYKPERSILQVHVAGYFGRRSGRREPTPQEALRRARSVERYGAPTFVVVGRTHDPSIMERLVPPKKGKGDVEKSSPGYLGYLFKKMDKESKSPDELLPLDFVPINLDYPEDWKRMFATRGFLVAMHVPSDFAKKKNELMRQLRQMRRSVDVRKPWDFLSELESYGYERVKSRNENFE